MSAQEKNQAVLSGGAWVAVLLVAAMMAAAIERVNLGLEVRLISKPRRCRPRPSARRRRPSARPACRRR